MKKEQSIITNYDNLKIEYIPDADMCWIGTKDGHHRMIIDIPEFIKGEKARFNYVMSKAIDISIIMQDIILKEVC